jgi:hypothetical protein
MHRIVSDAALDALFHAAPTRPAWHPQPVGDLCALGYGDDIRPAPYEGRPGGRDEVCCIP